MNSIILTENIMRDKIVKVINEIHIITTKYGFAHFYFT